MYPEPLPARVGRLVRRYSPDLAARICTLALALPVSQAHELVSLLVDADAEASDAALVNEQAAPDPQPPPRAPQALRRACCPAR